KEQAGFLGIELVNVHGLNLRQKCKLGVIRLASISDSFGIAASCWDEEFPTSCGQGHLARNTARRSSLYSLRLALNQTRYTGPAVLFVRRHWRTVIRPSRYVAAAP